MKKFSIIFLSLFLVCTTFAQHLPKREVRAVWLTTAWRLDFPQTLGMTNQQNELLAILDRLEASNYNTIYFQVRPMHDAFYRSNLPGEPWSHWLFGGNINNRGQDPGWSPLGFLIEHAHARGIEVHAWLNPYRYSSSPETLGRLSTDIFNTHPEWLIDYTGTVGSNGVIRNSFNILNPGIPEVKHYIADVVEDIIRNYNVDGIVFDDYFYQSGTTNAMDDAQFAANPNGFTAAQRGDWRRENVNEMIRIVQERINSISPWIQFGLSPAGIAMGTNLPASIPANHGVRPSPGIDWQYNDIFSDPVMWLRRGTIDYISPQIYWDTSTDPASGPPFGPVSEWWAEVSNQFGRHFFSSNTSHRGGSPNAPDPENPSAFVYNRFSDAEVLNQIQILRDADRNGTAGQVHFRYRTYLINPAREPGQDPMRLYDAMAAGPYRQPALTAMFGWKPAPMQGLVTNLNVSGENVTWNFTPNVDGITWNYTPNVDFSFVRYVIYAVPNANRNDADAFTSSRFLQGISYTTNFTLPDGISASTHRIGVAVFDRFGNLFPVRVYDESVTTIQPAQLIYPANNATDVVVPSIFTWEANGADFYIWQVAEDRDFERIIASRETTSPSFNLALQSNIKPNTTYYWRVKSVRANAPVSVSEVRVFNGNTRFQILTPANGDTDVSRTPEFTWTSMGDDATYILEISEQANFSNILHTDTVQATSATIPPGVLRIATPYHARLKTNLGTVQIVLDQIQFTTETVPVPVPVIISPVAEATIRGNEVTVSWKEQESRGFSAQLSNSPSFPTRPQDPIFVMQGGAAFNEFSTTFTNVPEGTYYLRVRASTTIQANTAWSAVVRIHVQEPTSVSENTVSEFLRIHHISDGIVELVINQAESNSATVEVYSLTGNLLDRQVHGLNIGTSQILLDMTNYARGIYLIRVKAGSNTKTLRVHR